LDEENKRFYIWLGDITIDKFTKSTFMNLVTFAESKGAVNMTFIQTRDHCQKGDFKKLFKVLDAIRVNKKGMKEILRAEKISSYVKQYALYQVDLN